MSADGDDGINAPGDVLVVDDVAANRFLYRALLEEDGHRVSEAQDGPSALKAIDRNSFTELVLLDVSMPGMDGLEVLQRLRARSDGGPSVLVLTAAAREPKAIERGLSLGADAYLTKPVDNRELAARVRAALQIARLRKRLAGFRRDQTAMLVHDLRHPLATLSLLAEVFEGDEVEREARLAAAATIRRTVDSLGRLVDTILTASRLEAGVFTVEPHPAEIGSIVMPSIELIRPLAARRQVALKLNPLPEATVLADGQRVRQVLDNLLANAMKFTPRGGAIAVKARVIEGFVELRVEDSGPGVSEPDRETIFDRYHQGAEGRARGGAGLGLAIARGIVEAHGGAIRCEASDAGGAAFVFTLPRYKSAPALRRKDS